MQPDAHHVELFQKAGAEANLRYLWSRLAARDLSGTEALAMLGVVHRQLGLSEVDDPRLYVSYARFMQALQREMPGVHQHVVKSWHESRNWARFAPTAHEPTLQEDAAIAEGETVERVRKNPEPEIDPRLRQFIQSVQSEVAHEEGPNEAGEPDEGDTEPSKSRVERAAGAAQEDDDNPGQEPEDELERETKEDGPEESDAQEEPTDAEELDSAEAKEVNAAQESGAEESVEARTAGQEPDSETEHNAEPDEANETNMPESQATSAEARAGAGPASSEEPEWPAEERPEPAEALEEFEGDEGEPPPLE